MTKHADDHTPKAKHWDRDPPAAAEGNVCNVAEDDNDDGATRSPPLLTLSKIGEGKTPPMGESKTAGEGQMGGSKTGESHASQQRTFTVHAPCWYISPAEKTINPNTGQFTSTPLPQLGNANHVR